MPESIHRALRVIRVLPEGRAGATLVFDDALHAQPGQFVMVWLPGVEERPFSVMDDDPLSVTVAAIGPFTRALCALRVGDRVWVRGPYGHGYDLGAMGAASLQRLLLVGGGSGTASLTLLAKAALRAGRPVTAAIGARTESLLMLPWRFGELGLEPILATDDGSCGFRGTVVEAVVSTGALDVADAVYGCGPEPMLAALAAVSRERSLPCWVSLERAIKCGLGVCGACHCGDRLVCRDGPVFRADEVFDPQKPGMMCR
ncbi:MAG: dihydroorotate dehydrogenase electron transfer subunit [Chloroflexi bacterium]|nr:dihydroorotate dehydrogenase electron transfer subunit [Chloroflexota bacterium]